MAFGGSWVAGIQDPVRAPAESIVKAQEIVLVDAAGSPLIRLYSREMEGSPRGQAKQATLEFVGEDGGRVRLTPYGVSARAFDVRDKKGRVVGGWGFGSSRTGDRTWLYLHAPDPSAESVGISLESEGGVHTTLPKVKQQEPPQGK